jgi:hypothetical protein
VVTREEVIVLGEVEAIVAVVEEGAIVVVVEVEEVEILAEVVVEAGIKQVIGKQRYCDMKLSSCFHI